MTLQLLLPTWTFADLTRSKLNIFAAESYQLGLGVFIKTCHYKLSYGMSSWNCLFWCIFNFLFRNYLGLLLSPSILRTKLRDCQFFQNYYPFNNTSADFVLISADVLLKMIIILKEVRIANGRTLATALHWFARS
jgi:hypothetical protein